MERPAARSTPREHPPGPAAAARSPTPRSRSSRGPGHQPFTLVTRVRIPYGTPLRNRTANAERRRFPASGGGEGAQRLGLRADDADLGLADLDPLRQGPKVVAPAAAGIGAHPPAGLGGGGCQHGRRDGRSQPLDGEVRTLGVGAGLVADGRQFGDAILQHRVSQIGDAGLDRVMEACSTGCWASLALLVEFGDAIMDSGVRAATLPKIRWAR